MEFLIDRAKISKQEDTSQFYWKLIGGNGETLCVSETFHNESDAIQIVNEIIEEIQAGNFIITSSED